MRHDLRVDLKAGDLVLRTARMALDEILGWQGILLRLRRSELWRFNGEGDGFRKAVEDEVARTSVFVNTTKHNAEFSDGELLGEGEGLDPDEALEPARVEGDRHWRLRLFVTEEGGDKEALRRRVDARLADVKLLGLKGGVLWEITLAAADEQMARGALTGLAISRNRERGLLLNPHFQEGLLLSVEEVDK
jgi:hypothetical protein